MSGEVLMLCPEAPYPLAGGGSLRTASLVDYFGRRGPLDLVLFREPGAPDPRQALPPGRIRDAFVLELPFSDKRPLPRLKRNLSRLFRDTPPHEDRFRGFESTLEESLGRRLYDLAVIEHFWASSYLDLLARHAARVVCDLHNIESIYYERRARAEGFPVALAWTRFAALNRELEQRRLPRFHCLLATSEPDAARLRAIAPCLPVVLYPNAIPEGEPQGIEPDPDLVVFSGNLEYPPNILAAHYFARSVWPLVRRQRPEMRWRLIGRHPERLQAELRDTPGIEFSGPVADAVAELARGSVAVVPLLTGSGTRLKILEAWAAGVPVVSTPLGAEGLEAEPGRHLLVAEAPEDFAHAVLRGREDRELRSRLIGSGRTLLAERYTWPAAWGALERAGL